MENPVAVISDIHSNFEALNTVLTDIREQEIRTIICLGDIVGYASSVRACLRAVRDLGCRAILGNHDEAVAIDSIPLTYFPSRWKGKKRFKLRIRIKINNTAARQIEAVASRITGAPWKAECTRNAVAAMRRARSYRRNKGRWKTKNR